MPREHSSPPVASALLAVDAGGRVAPKRQGPTTAPPAPTAGAGLTWQAGPAGTGLELQPRAYRSLSDAHGRLGVQNPDNPSQPPTKAL